MGKFYIFQISALTTVYSHYGNSIFRIFFSYCLCFFLGTPCPGGFVKCCNIFAMNRKLFRQATSFLKDQRNDYDPDPDPDSEWHQNDADPHADCIPSFTHVENQNFCNFQSQHCQLNEFTMFYLSFKSVLNVKCVNFQYYVQHIQIFWKVFSL